MQVKVRFIGLFRRYVGERERSFDIPDGSTAGDLLTLLGREYGSRLPENLWHPESGRFHRSIRIARTASSRLGEAEPLQEGDDLIVHFTMAGG